MVAAVVVEVVKSCKNNPNGIQLVTPLQEHRRAKAEIKEWLS